MQPEKNLFTSYIVNIREKVNSPFLSMDPYILLTYAAAKKLRYFRAVPARKHLSFYLACRRQTVFLIYYFNENTIRTGSWSE